MKNNDIIELFTVKIFLHTLFLKHTCKCIQNVVKECVDFREVLLNTYLQKLM